MPVTRADLGWLASHACVNAVYVATESALDKVRWSSLNESMKEAAVAEKRIAISKNSYHNGVPAISVIVYADWSKRLHKHSNNAKSGVGTVVGKETKKLLHVGVRNKYCSVCARAKTEGKEAAENKCYKNWEGTLSSMDPKPAFFPGIGVKVWATV